MGEHDEPKAALTRLLGEHFVMTHYYDEPTKPPGEWICSCGKKFGLSDSVTAHLADVLLAEGYTTSPAPESISGPHAHDGFQGCTDRDPRNCSCATDADPVCAACDEVIEAGEPYYALLKADYPFLPLDHADQDWSAVAWHERCDERTTVPVDRAADERKEGGQ